MFPSPPFSPDDGYVSGNSFLGETWRVRALQGPGGHLRPVPVRKRNSLVDIVASRLRHTLPSSEVGL
jgi:hypothetical protein